MKKNIFLRITILVTLILFTGSIIFFNVTAHNTTTTDIYSYSNIKNATSKDLENCIILEKDIVVLISNNKQEYVAYSEMPRAIKEQKDRFDIPGLNVVIKQSTDYHKAVYILSLFSKAGIKQFRLLKA
jgi:biopolymer transport protein ExbD